MKRIVLTLVPIAVCIGLTLPQTALQADTSDADSVLLGGTAVQVNADAVSSSQVVASLRGRVKDQLSQFTKNLDQKETITAIQNLVSQQVMINVYNLLLYQHVKRDLEKNANFERMMEAVLAANRKQIIKQFGSTETAALAALAKEGIRIEDLLEERKRELAIDSYRRAHFTPTLAITRRRMLQHYHRHLNDKYTLKASIKFQLIDIQLDQFSQQKNPAQLAKAQAESVLRKIQAGQEFTPLVQQYSHGFRKPQKGIWGPYQPDSLQDKYQPIVKALQAIEIGKTTGIIESENHFFIVKLLDRQDAGTIPFSKVQTEIQQSITQQRWQEYRADLHQTLLEKATLGNLELFATRCAHELLQRLKREDEIQKQP
ncbi:MAG: peptidylprolyl isomerase [Planctomycetes bacterium]|nr:peptidylprolyl isomerase [Planctomycetota bacterium]